MNVNIKRGILHGDSLFPLIFVSYLIPLSLVLKKANVGYQLRNSTKNSPFVLNEYSEAKRYKILNTKCKTPQQRCNYGIWHR